MSKLSLVLSILFLTGCNNVLYQRDIEAANRQCEDRGGIHAINVSAENNTLVICMEGEPETLVYTEEKK